MKVENMTINYNWTKFYSAFADKLLLYEKDRQSLLKKLVIKMVNQNYKEDFIYEL